MSIIRIIFFISACSGSTFFIHSTENIKTSIKKVKKTESTQEYKKLSKTWSETCAEIVRRYCCFQICIATSTFDEL